VGSANRPEHSLLNHSARKIPQPLLILGVSVAYVDQKGTFQVVY